VNELFLLIANLVIFSYIITRTS